jgi:hypothetical protein
MFRGSRRHVSMMAAISIGVLAAACSSSSSSPSSGSSAVAPPEVAPAANPVIPAAPVAATELRNTKTVTNYSALDRGLLTYTSLKTLRTGVPVALDITVIDIGRGLQLTSAPTLYHGEAVDPYDVPTSAEVAVQIICSDNLTCQSRSSQDSQFVNLKQEGNWAWSLSALNPGTGLIGIIAVTYEKGSDAFVHITPLWTISLKVLAAGT